MQMIGEIGKYDNKYSRTFRCKKYRNPYKKKLTKKTVLETADKIQETASEITKR
ncbi:hypothetical protein YTPLAS73_09740 [Nitrosarchaeum sp.]|nr:hypothetical protein YTPLAS73_09740 [Nitrosarchaeum sp.]